ncbi:MAG: hypothetical protein H6653_18880 [Ardenticatenaceae bacterium]|nr:hypothetical protein [Ardenticatenaceae bacterium]
MFLQHKRRFSILFMLFMAILLLTTGQSALAANDLFVNWTGTDSWAGAPNNCRQQPWFGMLTPPCRTLAHAISQASGGDTIYATGTFNEHDLVINKNLTIEGGAVDANGLGRHFEIRPGKTVVFEDMFFHNGSSTNGGSILNQGDLTLIDVEFTNNTAVDGGVIYNALSGFVVVDYGRFVDNQANRGGAIYTEGDLIIDGLSFFNRNAAETFGGVLFNAETAHTDFRNSIVYNSTASAGGALYNLMGGLGVWTTEIHDSVATTNGGAILNAQGTLILEDSILDNNTAVNGGALFNTVNDDVYMNIDAVVFEYNTAQENGGAIYDLSAEIKYTISNSTFNRNDAGFDGGALFLLGTSHVTLAGEYGGESLLENNDAVLFGGAIYNETNLTIRNVTLENNTGWEGGAVYNAGSGDLIIDRTALLDNTGHFRGGAIFDDATGSFTSVNSTYSGNDSLSYGGAIFYKGALAQLANVTLYGNSSAHGSGIYTASTVQMYNSIITASSVEDCEITGAGIFQGKRNLVDDFASGPCSGISPNAVSQIDAVLTGTPAVHAINGLSNAYNSGYGNCPDPLNSFAPLALDQQENTRLGVNVPCDIGAYELN